MGRNPKVKLVREVRKGVNDCADAWDREGQRQHEREMKDKELEDKRLDLELAKIEAQRIGLFYLNRPVKLWFNFFIT